MAVSNSDVRHEATPMSVTGMSHVGRTMSAEWETLETPIPLGNNSAVVCRADGSIHKLNSYTSSCNGFGPRKEMSETKHMSRNEHCENKLEKDKEISEMPQEGEKGKTITDLCDENVHEENKSRATYSVKGQAEEEVNEERDEEINDRPADGTGKHGAAMYVSSQPLHSQPSAADLAAEFEMHAKKSQSRHTLDKALAEGHRIEDSAVTGELQEDQGDKDTQSKSPQAEDDEMSKVAVLPESSNLSTESSVKGKNKGSVTRYSSAASCTSVASNNSRQLNSSAASNKPTQPNSSANLDKQNSTTASYCSAASNNSRKRNSSAASNKPTQPNNSSTLDKPTQRNSSADLIKPTHSKELAPFISNVSPNKNRLVPNKKSPSSNLTRQAGKKTGGNRDELATGPQCKEHRPEDVHSSPEPEVDVRRERFHLAEAGYDNGVQQKALLELMIKGLGNFTTTMADVMLGKLRPEYEVLARQVGQAVKEETTAELTELREKVATSEKKLEQLNKEKNAMKSDIEKEREEMKKEQEKDKLKRLKDSETKDATIDKLEKDLEKVQTQLKDKEKSTRKAEHKAKSEEHKRVKIEEEYQGKFKEMQTQLNKAKSDLLVLKSKRRLQTACGRRADDTGASLSAKLISHHGMYPRHMTHPKNVPYDEGDD